MTDHSRIAAAAKSSGCPGSFNELLAAFIPLRR
jgi:hypothetical protein